MKIKTIEINGTGTHNRGAELMAIAISENLRKKYPNIKLVVAPGFGSYRIRKNYNFYTTWAYEGGRKTIPWCFSRLLPKFILERIRIVDPKSVDLVLDASGFAFSDQWGISGAEKLYKKMSSNGRNKQKLVFLPQALGPFEHSDVAEWCRKLLSRAEMVCTRDEKSYEAVIKLAPQTIIKKYPDFTMALMPKKFSFILPNNFTAIVPNMRMMDRSDSGVEYLNFLNYCIKQLDANNMNPIFILHDAEEDEKVISLLSIESQKHTVIRHDDPQVLKGILGKATLVIGSRFHALVSAFSQGVPCIGAGWSHKYLELFRDFSAEKYLVADLADKNNIEIILNELSDENQRLLVAMEVKKSSQKLKIENAKMWEQVYKYID